MSPIVRFDGEDGSYMLVEVSGTRSDVELTSDDSTVKKATGRLEDSLASIRGAATALMSTVGQMSMCPHEVTLEIALSLEVEGGVVVAKGSAKAEASVTLTWRPEEALTTAG